MGEQITGLVVALGSWVLKGLLLLYKLSWVGRACREFSGRICYTEEGARLTSFNDDKKRTRHADECA